MLPETGRLYDVLVINDDSHQRERIASIIAGRCRVDAPPSYEEMMKKVRLLQKVPKAYALVILDYVLEFWPLPASTNPQEQMPKDGFEILQLLRPTKKEKEPEIYFLTNFPNPALMKQLRKDYGVVTAQYNSTTPLRILEDVEQLLGLR